MVYTFICQDCVCIYGMNDKKKRHLIQTSVNLYADQLRWAEEEDINLSELFRNYVDKKMIFADADKFVFESDSSDQSSDSDG